MPKKRQHQYEVHIRGDWAAFFMYLCVNAEKAWETGLAGSSIAKQLCDAQGLPYSKQQVVNSIGGITFSRMALVVDYREINELTKFLSWCGSEINPTVFEFIGKNGNPTYLDSDTVKSMGKCLWQWRESFYGYGELMPKECGDIIIDNNSGVLGAST